MLGGGLGAKGVLVPGGGELGRGRHAWATAMETEELEGNTRRGEKEER